MVRLEGVRTNLRVEVEVMVEAFRWLVMNYTM